MFQYSMVEAPRQSATVIKVIGCGGGGSNAVNRMIEAGVKGVDFIVINTDLQALDMSSASTKIGIGAKATGGLGAGGIPEMGEKAALEDTEAITNIVRGANMVFITAGMGGGTGTGAAPVVARIAREEGALTIGVVTKPFDFEGAAKMNLALEGISRLSESVDKLILIPNQNLFKVIDKRTSVVDAFKVADDVLRQSVQGISDIITRPGIINVDFKDVATTMEGSGEAIMGIGTGHGDVRATDAALAAINNPMLEDTRIDGAKNILVNIIGSPDISMVEVNDIIVTSKESAAPDVLVLHGVAIDESMSDEISVTVIATNFNSRGAGLDGAYSGYGGKQKTPDDYIDAGEFIAVTREKILSEAPGRNYADMTKSDPVNSPSYKGRAAAELDLKTPPSLRPKISLFDGTR
jgi:cell division protein FtsZ